MNTSMYEKICAQLEETRLAGNPYWNAGHETVSLLLSHILRKPACTMLEIGTSNGYTALRVVPALLKVGGTLVTIESHEERGAIATRNMHLAEVDDVVTLVQGHAPEVFSQIPGVFDVVFLDATKYEHQSYVEALIPRLRTGSVIIVDNICSHKEVMGVFVEYMRSLVDFVVTVEEGVDTGILIAQKVR